MKWKQLLLVVAVSATSAVGSVWTYGKLNKSETVYTVAPDIKVPANYAGYYDNISNGNAEVTDFTKAADAAVPAVVHIKTKIAARKISNDLGNQRSGDDMEDLFRRFFDNGSMGPQIQPEQRASGSGVLVAEDGYIVTNNHVVSNGGDGVADEITVTLHNKKVYKAKLIGRDPSSDLAVLKIDDKNLPYMIFGNSDAVRLGQWVLAVGYPLTLETTVTAGIISAKGRSIGINSRQSQTPVESFIQTDAAINQGNSGGALISTDGQLVGINSAILAPSGTYAGYGFAIPVNIVKKVVSDLIEFGDVKRGYLGISYEPRSELNDRLVKQAGLKDGQGVYVQSVPTDGAAYQAGLKKGDVITKINGAPVTSGIEMSAQIVVLKPGAKVPVSYVRGGKESVVNIVLKSEASTVKLNSSEILGDRLGVEMQTVDSKTAQKYNITGGVMVKKIIAGGPFSKTKMEEGFVITSVNGREIKSVDELSGSLSGSSDKLVLEGIYPGYRGVYSYQIPLDNDDE